MTLCLLLLLADPMDAGGIISADAVWSGEVCLVEDVVVRRGVTLTILPGTRIFPDKFVAGGGPGWNKDRLEIHVAGRIVARGTEREPIRFGVRDKKEPPELRTWLGIVLLPNRTELSEFARCVFRHAEAAVQVGSGPVTFRDCVFLDCDAGIGTTLWASTRRHGDAPTSVSTPKLERCRFAHCRVGVSVEGRARPEIRRCLFLECHEGVSNRRIGYTSRHTGIGPLVDRSEFVDCGTAVGCSSRITNSIFTGNRLVFASTAFHRSTLTAIDRYLRLHNLYWDNTTLANDDIPLGEGALMADPRRVGEPPDDIDEALLLGDLAHLVLSKDSPARGAARDKGDLGLHAQRGPTRGWIAPSDPGTGLAVSTWVVAGPLGMAPPSDRWRTRCPAPGCIDEAVLWVLEPCDRAKPRFSGKSLTFGPGRTRFAVTRVRSDAKRRIELAIGLDGAVRVWWNGSRVLRHFSRVRRFTPEDLRCTVMAREGVNTLALEVEPRGESARLLVRLLGDGLTAESFDLPEALASVTAKVTR